MVCVAVSVILLIVGAFMQLGGLNSLLAIEQSKNLPLVSKVPTIIFGMDVSHGSPGHSNVPSVAAVRCNSLFSLQNVIVPPIGSLSSKNS